MEAPTLLKAIRNINTQERIIKIVKDIRNTLSETYAKGILFRVMDTTASMVLAALAVKAIHPSDIRAIYFIRRRRYRMPLDLNRLLDYLKIRYEYIEIGSLTKSIESYISGYTDINIENIRETIIALVLRELSDKYELLLLGEIDKTIWLTGAFNPIYTKIMDLLPLTYLYASQLNKLASELHIMPYIRKVSEYSLWRKFKEKVGLNDDEIIDAILYGIGRNKTDIEIYKELEGEKVSLKTVRTIRGIVENRYLRRNGPLVSP